MNCHHPVCAEGRTSSRSFLHLGLVLLTLTLAAGLLAPRARAQDPSAGTGTITGRVLNAANGKFLPNARIVVEDTPAEALTNEFGEYTLRNIPAGEVRLTASFTGQAAVTATVMVPAGQAVSHEFQLNRRGRATEAGGPLVLDEFVVATERFRNAREIAINEERYAPNIKNVVSADAFGDIPEGNIGEFIKFIPGVLVDYGTFAYSSGADATAISVRGFGPEHTEITIDGVPVSNASQGALTRAVGLDMLSINNASRVEVVKVPTPDMPSNSIGGSVNLISKSAFEYAKPTFTWRGYVSLNSENLDVFKKTPGPANEKTYKTLPGFDFTYAIPLSKTLGVSFTGATSNQFNENHRAKVAWSADANKTDAATGQRNDVTAPFLRTIEISDDPRTSNRHSGAVKVDWKPLPGHTVSVSHTLSYYDSVDANRRFSLSSETPETWSPTTNIGKWGSGQKGDLNTIFRDKEGVTNSSYVNWRYDRGPWQIGAVAAYSVSKGWFRDESNGHFSDVEMNLASVGQVVFEDIANGVPGRVTVYDENDPTRSTLIDPSKLASYGLTDGNSFRVRSSQTDARNTKENYKIDVRRELDFIPSGFMQLAVKAGFYRQVDREEKWGRGNHAWQYVGPADAITLSDYRDDVYSGSDPTYGFPPQEWVDPYKMYQLYQAHPEYFSDTTDDTTNNGQDPVGSTQSVAAFNYDAWVSQQKSIKETSDAWYALLDGRFWRNRVSLVAGIRQEQAKREGYGPFQNSDWEFLRNPDGTMYRDDANPRGVKITDAGRFGDAALRSRLTAAGVNWDHVVIKNSLEAKMLEKTPFYHVRKKSKGDPSYSANVAVNVTKDLVARVAWARTFGKPNYEDGILTNVSFNETDDPAAFPRGTISIGNPALQPWVADNWDFSLTYYTPNGGKVGVGYFTKDVKNFHKTLTYLITNDNYELLMEEYGLAPSDAYVDWQISTTVNGEGTAKTEGYEFEVSQNLGFLGRWGKPFDLFATYTTKKLSQNQTDKLRPTSNDFATGGINFSARRISLSVKATWRTKSQTQRVSGVFYIDPATGSRTSYTDLYLYEPEETKLDLNFNYQFSRRYGFFINARNFLNTNKETIQLDERGLLPGYARVTDNRDFGVQWTVGIRGMF